MPKVLTQVQACYWIVGIKTAEPFLCVDIHDGEGDLLNHEENGGGAYHEMLPRSDVPAWLIPEAERRAIAYAASWGVPPDDVCYDEDSTLHTETD